LGEVVAIKIRNFSPIRSELALRFVIRWCLNVAVVS
jgi:hypothetical protein